MERNGKMRKGKKYRMEEGEELKMGKGKKGKNREEEELIMGKGKNGKKKTEEGKERKESKTMREDRKIKTWTWR